MKICDKCPSSLEHGEVTYYKGNEVVETLCNTCAKGKQYKAYSESKVLTTSLLMDSSMIAYDLKNGYPLKTGEFSFAKNALEIEEYREDLKKDCKRLEKEVWFNGLQKLLSKTTKKGISAKFDHVSVLTYCICARCMITLESEDGYSLTLITEEDSQEPRMGIQGVCATFVQAKALVDLTVQAWKDGKLEFKEDTEVHIAGFPS
jgi:hypothetical protein